MRCYFLCFLPLPSTTSIPVSLWTRIWKRRDDESSMPKGVGGMPFLNEKEFNASFRVTRVIQNGFVELKISWPFIVPTPADWVPYLDYDNLALNLASNSIVN